MWGELKNGMKEYPLHEGQSDVMRSTARVTAAFAGTGGGKSVVGALWSALQIERLMKQNDPPQIPGMIIAPTYQILERATVPIFIETLRGTALEGRYLSSRRRYILANGWAIWFLSGDKAEGIEGGQTGFAWVDEAGQISYRAWVAIQGRTGQRRSPILLTTTLYRMNWTKREIVKRFRDGDPDYNVITFRSTMNPTYPQSEYDRAKDVMSPALFGMRYDGVFPPDDALVFSSFDEAEHVRECPYDPNEPVLVSCNFAANPCVWLLAQRRPAGVIEIIGELIEPDGTTRGMLGSLRSRFSLDVRFHFFGDAPSKWTRGSAALSDYQLIQSDGRFQHKYIHMPFREKSITDRIAATNARFQKDKLFIDERCASLVTDLETRFYEDDWREPQRPQEEDDAGPVSDALTFMMHSLFPITPVGASPVLIGAGSCRN